MTTAIEIYDERELHPAWYGQVSLSLSPMRSIRLIARWGDALASWESLMASAREIMAAKASDALDRLIRKAAAMRESIKATGSWPSAQVPELSNVPEGW